MIFGLLDHLLITFLNCIAYPIISKKTIKDKKVNSSPNGQCMALKHLPLTKITINNSLHISSQAFSFLLKKCIKYINTINEDPKTIIIAAPGQCIILNITPTIITGTPNIIIGKNLLFINVPALINIYDPIRKNIPPQEFKIIYVYSPFIKN